MAILTIPSVRAEDEEEQMRPQQRSGGSGRRRLAAAAASVALIGGLCVVSVTTPGLASTRDATHLSQAAIDDSTCHLAHGIKHIVQIGFDNVHFFRDNPNVPSDLQLLPNLLNFIEHNGTLLSNNHTPLIAHTGDDLLTTATGIYGDRHGDPISNAYQVYNPDGTTDSADVFAYWNDPIDDTSSPPNAHHDTNPNLVYSPTPPATTRPAVKPDTITPAPWVPYTEAGCNVGEIATVNQELENPSPDLAEVFGPHSPEVKQLNADPDPYKDPEVADYIGLAVHCAKGNAFCADAEAVKYGEKTKSHTAVADRLPDQPGGYAGYQALFGNKYIAPQLGAGKPDVKNAHGYLITDKAGNLVDLDGNQMNGAYLTDYPGFPGYDSINAAQSLAYAADMLESGVPVVNIYMADLHGNQYIPGMKACASAPDALGSGSQCYLDQAAYYNHAFGVFFGRLAKDGITPKNTLYVISSDEGDHEAGANVGRAIQPTPANCNGGTVSGGTVKPGILCTYPSGSFGELDGNVTGLLAEEEHNTTSFSLEADTAPEFYLTGNPGPDTATVRKFEHAVAGLTADDPYSGHPKQKLALYLADPTEEAILHMVDADPARTPTLAMFANPDYYLQTGSTTCKASGLGGCVYQTDSYAWDHGDYVAEVNTNYVGFVGPGVRNLGLDGPAANKGTTSSGPDSGLITVADDHFPGPWVDETDIRPTIMYLTGLEDRYQYDGRVITQILADPNPALRPPQVTNLGECYKQLNSSVGDFAAYTLQADTNAIESSTAKDQEYLRVDAALRGLEFARDRLAELIKGELQAAAFDNVPVRGAVKQLFGCQAVIRAAQMLAQHTPA
jgi:hypothetical protein